mgnify:CR=1 FL=1
MRIGLVEFLLILAIASLTVGPQVALFVDRWMRRANRANARAARRRAEYAAQMAAERDALLKRFRTASTVFGWHPAGTGVCAGVPAHRHPAAGLHRAGGAPEHRRRADSPFCRQPGMCWHWETIRAWTASVSRTALCMRLRTTARP